MMRRSNSNTYEEKYFYGSTDFRKTVGYGNRMYKDIGRLPRMLCGTYDAVANSYGEDKKV
jgi:hypothetical protein